MSDHLTLSFLFLFMYTSRFFFVYLFPLYVMDLCLVYVHPCPVRLG